MLTDNEDQTPLDEEGRRLMSILFEGELTLYDDEELLEGCQLVKLAQSMEARPLIQLNQCYVSGPISDGDLCSKFERDTLV